MAKTEPQFDLQRVTWVRMSYPNAAWIKSQVIKNESEMFRKKVKNDLCEYLGLSEEEGGLRRRVDSQICVRL